MRVIDLKTGLEAAWRGKGMREGSFKAMQPRFERILKHFGEHHDARKIDFLALSAFMNERLQEAARATVKLELALLSAAMKIQERAGLLKRPPFPTIKVENARTGFFDERAFRQIQEQLSWDLRNVVEFLWLTGWRVSEAIGLRWADVDLKTGWIVLPAAMSKNRRQRKFPFETYPALKALMLRQRAATDVIERRVGKVVATVFWRDSAMKPWTRDGAPIKDFHKAWRGARKRAGYPAALIHDFRRTAVRRMDKAGVRRSVQMKLVGLLTESIHARYNITDDDADLKEGVRQVDEAGKRKTEPPCGGA